MAYRFVRLFEHELQRPDPAPEVLALTIAGLAFDDLDIAYHVAEIDRIARAVALWMPAQASGHERALHLMDTLRHELGFRGNREDYYDPGNSFLNVVLERRMGLPILLAVVCIAVGRRLDLRIEGLGFPGHFVAQIHEDRQAWLLDLFYGRVIPANDAERYLGNVLGHPVTLPEAARQPVDAQYIARRILNNLRSIYLVSGDSESAVRVLDYLLILMPGNPALWHERGMLHYRSMRWERSSRDLRRYCYLTGRLEQVVRLMGGQSVSELALAAEERQLLATVKHVEEMRMRIN